MGYAPAVTGPRCIYYKGFSLRANTKCVVWERTKLENLYKYINRPPVAYEGVSITPNGQILFKMKTSYQDGTSHPYPAYPPFEYAELRIDTQLLRKSAFAAALGIVKNCFCPYSCKKLIVVPSCLKESRRKINLGWTIRRNFVNFPPEGKFRRGLLSF